MGILLVNGAIMATPKNKTSKALKTGHHKGAKTFNREVDKETIRKAAKLAIELHRDALEELKRH